MSTPRQRGLTGIIPVRNGDELDYCWRLSLESMVPVCQEVIISDGGSTDGTLEAAQKIADNSGGRIRCVQWPWPEPRGDHWFLQKWLVWTQEKASYDMVCHLDADEVYDPGSFPKMREAVHKRESLWFHRINLWRDPQHEAPHNTVCSQSVVYLNCCEDKLLSDNIYPGGNDPEHKVNAKTHDSLRIWHLGFLRDKKKFLAKARCEQLYLINTFDPRLAECEVTGEDWVEKTMWPDRPLIEHGIELPLIIKPWLEARGHCTDVKRP